MFTKLGTSQVPMARRGRDLRMLLEVRATADGDQFLTPLIEQAVLENSEGKMFAGKRTVVERDGARVELVMVDYAQTWDGDPS